MNLCDIVQSIPHVANNAAIRLAYNSQVASEIIDIRDRVFDYNSSRRITSIQHKKDYLQENSLRYLFVTVLNLKLKNRRHLECVDNSEAFAMADPRYAARQEAIGRYETEIIPKYETVFGDLDRFRDWHERKNKLAA